MKLEGGGLSDEAAGEDVLSVSQAGKGGSEPLWANVEGGGETSWLAKIL